MASELTGYDFLIAAPSDVPDECKAVREAISKWNSTNKDERKIILSAKQWITDVIPALGTEPQSIVNQQIVEPSDVLIGIFWTRIGTPTKKHISGTIEEIEQFIKDGKPVLLYFSDKKVKPDQLDRDQYQKLQEVRKKYQQVGIVRSISSPTKFKEDLIHHLTGVVNQLEKERIEALESIKAREAGLDSQADNVSLDLDNLPISQMSLRKRLQQVFSVIEGLVKGETTGINTGFKDFDAFLAGLNKKNLMMVSGYPGSGKSSFIRSMAGHISIGYGKSVAYFVPNKDATNEVLLFLAGQANVNAHWLKLGKLPQRDYPRLSLAVGPMSESDLFIDGSANLSVDGIRDKLLLLIKVTNIDVVFIDDLYSLNPPVPTDSVRDSIFKNMQKLKALAAELNVALVVTCPCVMPEERYSNEPQLSYIDTKGPISEMADIVGFIYRKEMHNLDASRGEVLFSIHKNSNGPIGDIHLMFNSDSLIFNNKPDSDTKFEF